MLDSEMRRYLVCMGGSNSPTFAFGEREFRVKIRRQCTS